MILSQDEEHRIIAAVMAGMDEFDEEDCERAVEWAIKARINAVLLLQVLTGEVTMTMPDNHEAEPNFRRTDDETKSMIEELRAGMEDAEEDV